MPAEKGIPKPEASARRLDVRNYDSREAWGWLSEDERLIMSKEGVAYVEYQIGGGQSEGPNGETIGAQQTFDILREALAMSIVFSPSP